MEEGIIRVCNQVILLLISSSFTGSSAENIADAKGLLGAVIGDLSRQLELKKAEQAKVEQGQKDAVNGK